jgi:hypothetical protein
MLHDHISKIYALGAAAPFAGLAISHNTVNQWLQTVSLSIGIMVGLITVFTFIARKTGKNNSKD